MKPSANGVNQLEKPVLTAAKVALVPRNARRSRHGSTTSEPNNLAAVMTATNESRSGMRVSSSSSLRMFCTVLKPIRGRNSAKVISAVSPASFSALPTSTRGAVATLMSYLLDFGSSQQALRQEDQRDGEDRERRDVLVIDREVGRPHGFDQADQQSADHGAGERADAAEHRRREGFDAGHEAVIEADHAVIHQVHGAGDGGQGRPDHEGDRDGTVDVDADQRRHLLVLLAGALGAAERGFRHQ